MQKKRKKYVAWILIAALLFGTGFEPVLAGEASLGKEGEVIVFTLDDFMAALEKQQSPIVVNNLITVQNGAAADGRMIPVTIPAGTVIRGNNETSELNFRCPLQLGGDGVVFEQIKMVFESSDALNSVPHREIFLAGHSLTLDHVDTYLEGSGGSLGGLGGSEKELLPTVYAGGFRNSAVGANASLTVRNSISTTMFQGIYMSHGAGADNKEPYYGEADLQLDAPAVVRDGVFTDLNSRADIRVSDPKAGRYANAIQFYGNGQTELNVTKCAIMEAVLENVGSVVLADGGHIELKSGNLQNVSVKENACLDLSKVNDTVITGDFAGQEASLSGQMGMLVLKSDGRLRIDGAVTGVTRFHTGSKAVSGALYDKWAYITANCENPSEANFLLAEKMTENGYTLEYEEGAWTVHAPDFGHEDVQIGGIEVASKPSTADISAILGTDDFTVPDESVFCELLWRDLQGNPIDSGVVEEYGYYDFGYMVLIQTDCLNSDDPDVLNRTDWGNWIWFVTSEENPGRYYLHASEGAKSGDYTFLMFSEPVDTDDTTTAAEVKALQDLAMARFSIVFYDSAAGETPPVHQHSYTSQVTEEATCNKTGLKTYTCSGCGDSYTEEIAKKGHTEVVDAAVSASCTQTGKTEGSHCSECGEVICAQEEIPKTPHNYEERVTKPATCQETGIKTKTCRECQAEETGEIAKIPHTEEIDPAVAASCTQAGKTEGSHCSECGEVIRAQEEIPKTPHNYEEAVTKPATCQETGIKTKICRECQTEETEEIPKIPHSYEERVTKPATCQETGVKTKTCRECQAEETEEIAKIPHTEEIDPAVAASCTQAGKTEGSHCSECGEVIRAQEEIPKTPHNYEEAVTKPATCQETGIKTKICRECQTEETEEIPKIPHSYEERVTKPATCQETGVKTKTCRECQAEETEEIAKIPHTEEIDPAVAASCTQAGKTEGSHCSECGEVIRAQEEIPKTPHNYEEAVTKPATCQETGIKTKTCRECQAEETEEISKTDHTVVKDPAQKATCTKEGKTEGSHCSICKKVIQPQISIPVTLHHYQKKVTKATLSKNGANVTKCMQCGTVLQQNIIYSPKTVSLSSESYTYSGKENRPAVTVKDSAGKMIDGKYYTVSYQNNQNSGIASVVLTFKDCYSGVLTETFTIAPKSINFSKVKAKSNKIALKWKKQKKQASGYKIQYSTNKKFKGKTTKVIKIGKPNAESKTISKLKSGKKYYIRICVYKTVKSNGNVQEIESGWSKAKSVKLAKKK